MSPTETLSMIHLSHPGIPVVVPELPASWGLFYQAGKGNPHSPLRKTSTLNGKCCFFRVSIEFNDLSYNSRVPPRNTSNERSRDWWKVPKLVERRLRSTGSGVVIAIVSIEKPCLFVVRGATLAGVVVEGNFTSLRGIEAQSVAMFDPTQAKVSPLTGLSGQVRILLCNEDTNTVYVRGDFKGLSSSNAIAWVGTADGPNCL